MRQIAVEAYIYLYPMVMMDVTRRQMTNIEADERVGFGPMNAFTHVRAFPPPEFKAVPWANFDTLYSLARLDLRDEPLILSTPDTAGCYYVLPIPDRRPTCSPCPASGTTVPTTTTPSTVCRTGSRSRRCHDGDSNHGRSRSRSTDIDMTTTPSNSSLGCPPPSGR